MSVLAALLVAALWPCDRADAAITEVQVPDAGGSGFKLHIYAPEVDDELPLIFFVPGFEGDVPVKLYSDLLRRIVGKGYIVAGAHHLEVPNYPKGGRSFLQLLRWAQEGGLASELHSHGVEAKSDVNKRTAVMGQSEGNHDIGVALATDCSIAKAAVLIDPVDGVDPYGIIKNQNLIQVGKKLNFSIPALLLDNGLDDKHNFGSPACMPPAMGTRRWMDAWNGPYWRLNATAYGHIDCLDGASLVLGKLVCPSDPRTDKAAYREMLASAIDIFLRALFEGKNDDFSHLEIPDFTNISVIAEHNLQGLNPWQLVPGCSNRNEILV